VSKVLPFASEADLCRAFLTWVSATAPDVTAYSEWAGWDILLAYPEGFQLGIQAKLRLNAEVIGQAAPGLYDDAGDCGPDFRGVLVPANNGLSAIAGRLGLVVFAPLGYRPGDFNPDIRYEPRRSGYHGAWLDWNPRKRHDLPPTVTDAIAGSSAPVSLTPWKLRALHVLAEIALRGPITTKRVRELGVDPRRWLENGWLVPVGERERGGLWCRGESCPRFDEQHPTAYQHAVTERGGDA
jgi:hypothetical protein